MLEYHGNIQTYCHVVGADESLGSNIFRIINIKSSCRFFMYFHYKPMADNDAPGEWPVWIPGGGGARLAEDLYTLLYTKYESSRPCGFREDFFICFSHCQSMGANVPRGGTIFDPRGGGMVGRVYKEDHYTLLHTKYESSGPCGFR